MAKDRHKKKQKKSKKLEVLQSPTLVVLPGEYESIHFMAGDPRTEDLLKIMDEKRMFLAVPEVAGENGPTLHHTGTLAHVVEHNILPEDHHVFIIKGVMRAKLGNHSPFGPFFETLLRSLRRRVKAETGLNRATYEPLPDQPAFGAELKKIEEMFGPLMEEMKECLFYVPDLDESLHVQLIEDFQGVIDSETTDAVCNVTRFAKSYLNIDAASLLPLLDTDSASKGLEILMDHISAQRKRLAQEPGAEEVYAHNMGKIMEAAAAYEQARAQEKAAATPKQAGNATTPAHDDTIGELHQQMDALGEALPAYARDRVEREIKKLKHTPESSGESAILRNHIDWLLGMPWGKVDPINSSIAHAAKVLDEDHCGLEKVKKRILEDLATRKLSRDSKAPILCLVGPPGVGKTSLGESIARATGRKFARIALGGVYDEAEIRGHMRTYMASMPGRLVRAIKDAGVLNPVIMLDEVDNFGADRRGDPAAALLEALDPAQNKKFRDRYLDIELDLSQILFIATANVADKIPAALRDRMETMDMRAYTPTEKMEIAKKHLLPRQMKQNGVDECGLTVDDTAIAALIAGYTKEAGVRQLEREIGKICRHHALAIADTENPAPAHVSAGNLEDIVGRKKIQTKQPPAQGYPPGVTAGLAWTATGGEMLMVEASTHPADKPTITVTGNLQDVMKESTRVALTAILAGNYGVTARDLNKKSLHIHFPEGAVPKDGPSAGITIATSLLSELKGIPVPADLAMTGEITIKGDVLDIGGLPQKLQAAFNNGARRVLIPQGNFDNGDHIEDVPEDVRKSLRISPVRHVSQVFREAGLLTAAKTQPIRRRSPLAQAVSSPPGLKASKK